MSPVRSASRAKQAMAESDDTRMDLTGEEKQVYNSLMMVGVFQQEEKDHARRRRDRHGEDEDDDEERGGRAARTVAGKQQKPLEDPFKKILFEHWDATRKNPFHSCLCLAIR